MSKCTLHIELDRPDRLYYIGDQVRCTVHVQVDKKVKCNGLVVSKSWITHGQGNRDRGDLEEQTLFKGEWEPGSYSYPCTFTIGPGPITYHGHYINVDWQIHASADIPWAMDPRSDLDFIVERGEQAVELPDVRQTTTDPQLLSQKYGRIVFIFPLIFIVIGLGFSITSWMDTDIFGLIFGAIFTMAGLGVAYSMIRNGLAQRKLGNVTFQVEPNHLRAGEEARATLFFQPRKQLNLNQITACLVAEEKAVSGSGTRRRTYSHTIHKQDYSLMEKRQLAQDMPVEQRFRVNIPDDAPHTFIADNNSLQWALELTIDIDNWPDWVHHETIRVLL